jgi:hypothetical protein
LSINFISFLSPSFSRRQESKKQSTKAAVTDFSWRGIPGSFSQHWISTEQCCRAKLDNSAWARVQTLSEGPREAEYANEVLWTDYRTNEATMCW